MSKKQSISEKINDSNIESIRKQIEKKNGTEPFFGTMDGAKSVITDIDHHPYTRFYRGVYNSSDPVVFEREAGWRPIHNNCYRTIYTEKSEYPNHCFESACSTVYPCYPQYLHKFSDRDALNVQLNRACIVQYR